jgi:hypothetical protein
MIKDLNNVNNERNCLLATFKVCSKCKCFFSVPNARLQFKQLCLKNCIINILREIQSLNNLEFDDYFINDSKTFIADCFVSKERKGLNL